MTQKAEEKLKIEQKEDSKYYICPIDGTLLVEVKNGEAGMFSSCKHFQWEGMSIACYIGIGDECNPNEIKEIRKKAVIKVFEGIMVYLLIPKSQ